MGISRAQWKEIRSFILAAAVQDRAGVISAEKRLLALIDDEEQVDLLGVRRDWFDEFWKLWPVTDRKTNRKGCLAKWKAKKLDAVGEAILDHVRAMKRSQKWREGYEPRPDTYLNQEQWNDGVPPDRATPQGVLAVAPEHWQDSAAGIIRHAAQIGEPPQGADEPFHAFRERVMAAAMEAA